MNVTINSPFKAAPRISQAKFLQVLESVGSFDADALWGPTLAADRPAEAGRIYDLIVSVGHDPGVWLAILGKESTFGTNPNSVLWRNNTRSWTNARSVRDPSVKQRSKVIRDRDRGSDYVRYESVYDSVLDGLYRVDEPGYAYRRAGAVSIVEHIRIWAPDSDGNRSEQYAATMADWIATWMAGDTGTLPKPEEPMTAQIPGFTWHAADSDHYSRGRTARIRGVAIHYTAGTSSLGWLTRTSVPPVSATFLIRPRATLTNRGWQLVRIEDTAWTTAFANPYTVSIEVEHDGKGPLPADIYPVIAQTVIDIERYVKDHNLGVVPLDRTGVKPHKEWVNNPALVCSDGVDTNRVVAAIQDIRQVAPPADALYLPANPFGDIPVVLGFKGLYLETGTVKYPDNPVLGGLSLYGYPEGEEYPTDFGSTQVFERAIFKFFKDAQRPWDLVIAHRAEPVPERRAA